MITAITYANQPSKAAAPAATKADLSFYAQCVQPKIDFLQKKYQEAKPVVVQHKKNALDYHAQLAKTTEYSVAKTCIGLALITDLFLIRGYAHGRSNVRNAAQLAAGFYLTAPLANQVYNDLLKRK